MLKAILTTLLVASSASVAMADHPYYDHHRVERRYPQREMTLAQGMSLGSSGQPRFIPIDARFQPSRLRFDLRRGRAFVDSITLLYLDGGRETIRVGQPLNRRNPTVVLDIQRGGLRGVIVDTRQRGYARGGGFRRATAIVDVVGIR